MGVNVESQEFKQNVNVNSAGKNINNNGRKTIMKIYVRSMNIK